MQSIMSHHPSLNGRVILITGASRGLGREMALALAGSGARLALLGSQPSEALDSLAEEISDTMILTADVARAGQAAAVVAEAEAHFGRIDVLVNNAGLGMRRVAENFNTTPTKFWETSPAAWSDIIGANVNGPFFMARAAVPGMVERGFGKVINVSTSAQTMIRRGYAPYGPSKAALEAYSRVWAQDLEGSGVDVNVYLPGGAADTDLLPPSANKKGADGNLLPADIMRRGIGWLCSDASNGVTGARFIARMWDESLPPDEAARGARDDHGDMPRIL